MRAHAVAFACCYGARAGAFSRFRAPPIFRLFRLFVLFCRRRAAMPPARAPNAKSARAALSRRHMHGATMHRAPVRSTYGDNGDRKDNIRDGERRRANPASCRSFFVLSPMFAAHTPSAKRCFYARSARKKAHKERRRRIAASARRARVKDTPRAGFFFIAVYFPSRLCGARARVRAARRARAPAPAPRSARAMAARERSLCYIERRER